MKSLFVALVAVGSIVGSTSATAGPCSTGEYNSCISCCAAYGDQCRAGCANFLGKGKKKKGEIAPARNQTRWAEAARPR